jgi:hypothetical protein
VAYYCPKCSELITSRRRGYCTSCQEPLPDEMLLTKEELDALEAMDKEREEKQKKRIEAEEEKRRTESDDDSFFPFHLYY